MKKVMSKLLTVALAIALVMMLLPAAFAASVTYTFDATTDLEAMAAGTKADGDTMKVGTDNYFTIIFSAKTKIDGSKKKFDDGYTATQRLNFQGQTIIKEDDTKNAVQFTTSGPATVKIWWVCGGSDDGNGGYRNVAIFSADGTKLAQSEFESTANTPYLSEFTVDAAGTYYVGNTGKKSNYIFKIEVTETVAESASSGTTYTVKAGDTLGKIALAHYGIVEKYQAIFEANRHILSNPNTIYVGQVLTLPEANLLAPAEGETLYTIQPGDTLGKIALAHYGSMAEYKAIFDRNSTHLASPSLIYAGQVIVLPAK